MNKGTPAAGSPVADLQNGAQEPKVDTSAVQSANTPIVAQIVAPPAANDPLTAQPGESQPTAPVAQSAAVESNAPAVGVAATELSQPAAKALETGKAETATHATAKYEVAKILRGIASATEKSVETVVQASVTVAKDAVNVLKDKGGANDAGTAAASNPVVGAKTELPMIAKAESSSAPVAADPGKSSATNSGNDGESSPNGGDSSNADSSAGAGSNISSKEHGAKVGPEPMPGVTPAPQSDPLNQGKGVAPSTSPVTPTPAKDSINPAKSANGNGTDNGGTAVPDADDAKSQMLESKAVNVAQLTGNEAHSEVRIAMQADQLGQVELHATVSGQQVGAAITVEKKEAHAAMAVELPSLQQALEERQLRVSEVVLTQSALHSTAGDPSNAGNAPAEQRRNQAGTHYQQAQRDTAYGNAPAAIFENSGMFDGHGRLSVRV